MPSCAIYRNINRAGTRLMANDSDFVRRCLFLFSCLGPVEAKRMFGGHGLFLDGIMVALLASDRLFLKADEESAGDFAATGSEPFTYQRGGKAMAMSYWKAPEAAMSDPGAMEPWAQRAAAAARRAAQKKPRRRSQKTKTRDQGPKLQTTGNRE